MVEVNTQKTPTSKNHKPGFLSRLKLPSSFTIILGLILLFIVISWILKASGASYTEGTKTHKIVGLGILDVFTSIWYGFKDKAEVVLFILCVGGMLNIMTRTKAIDAGIQRVVDRLNGKEIYIIPILMLIFSLGGTTYGMWEETIAFFPILIPVFIKAGLGPFTAVLTILVGAGSGSLASTVNPFAVGAVPTETGFSQGIMMGSRWLTWVIYTAVGIAFVTYVGYKTKQKAYNLDGLDSKTIEEKFKSSGEKIHFNLKRKITITIFSLGFVLMILAYLPWNDWIGEKKLAASIADWDKNMFWLAESRMWEGGWGAFYFISIAGLFLIISLIIFAINHNDFVEKGKTKEAVFIDSFVDGAKDVLSVCLLIGTAAGLGHVLATTKIGPLIAHQASSLKSLGVIGFAIVIFIMSIFLAFLLPSTSGFAAAFVPIFMSIATVAFKDKGQKTLEGVYGLIVFGFIFAEGIVNLIAPTSAALMAYTKFAGVEYPFWIKKVGPIVGVFTLMAFALIIVFSIMVQEGVSF